VRWNSVLTFAFCVWLVAPAHALNITVVNGDGAGEGFNDATVVAPVGGNTGTTRGAQRLIAFQHGADLWGDRLGGTVPVQIMARFDNLGGTAMSAILGSASPWSVWRDFAGAERPSTWYPSALANQMAGIDLDSLGTPDPEIDAQFNSAVDNPTVLGARDFYYGLDGNSGDDVDFLSVVLHEIGHGLGFLDLLDPNTGSKFHGLDDAFTLWLEDPQITPRRVSQMSDAQRKIAMRDDGNLLWFGPNVRHGSGSITSGRRNDGRLQMYAPAVYEAGSSVAHFDTDITPNQLMEPFLVGVNQNLALTLDVMADLGWETVEDPRCCDDEIDCTLDTCFDEACQHAADDGECADDDPCTQNVCDLQEGCTELPTTESCNDGQFCTVDDVCTNFACTGTPRACDDGVPCTTDSCDEQANACTASENDAACADNLFCNGQERCDENAGCLPGEPVDCDGLDGPCGEGVCDEQDDACVSVPANEGQACDDDLFCTVSTFCTQGACEGSPRDCSLFNGTCLEGACEEEEDQCVSIPGNEGDPCDDGNICTQEDSCTQGVCLGSGNCNVCGDGSVGAAEECDDGNVAFSPGERCAADCELVPCGKPTNSPGNNPTASDALFTLRAAVGQATCVPQVCNVDSAGGTTASDALRILKAAVGQNIELSCPA